MDSTKRGVAWAAMLLLLLAPINEAAEVELAAANVVASSDTNVKSYSGEVTLKVPAGTQMQMMAKAMKNERGKTTLRGEVQIIVQNMTVRTEQAMIVRNIRFTLVKMDTAEVITKP